MGKFWVTKELGEYVILTDGYDEQAGNHYIRVADGFDVEEDALEAVELMNKDLQLYLDSEDALCYHDPSERMKELGYAFENGKWRRKNNEKDNEI